MNINYALWNPLHVDVECRPQVTIFQQFFKLEILLPYLDSEWKVLSNKYKQA